MKKIFLSVIALLAAFVIMPVVNAAEKVPVYIFTKNGCPACESAFEYFNNLESQYPDLFEQKVLEVWSGSDASGNWILGSQELYDLMLASLERAGGDTKGLATPTIFIGDYLTVGLPSDRTELYNAILEARDSEDSVNIVKEEAEKLNINLDEYSKTETNAEETGKYDAIIIIGIFVVLIGGFAGLIILGKK